LLLVFASSFEEVITSAVFVLDVHLCAPCLTQVLLHDLIFSHQCSVFKVLRVCGRTQELLIIAFLVLTTGLTQLPVGVDLVGQVGSQEFLLGVRRLEVDSNLIKSLLGTEVRLVVELLKLVL